MDSSTGRGIVVSTFGLIGRRVGQPCLLVSFGPPVVTIREGKAVETNKKKMEKDAREGKRCAPSSSTREGPRDQRGVGRHKDPRPPGQGARPPNGDGKEDEARRIEQAARDLNSPQGTREDEIQYPYALLVAVVNVPKLHTL